MILFRWNPAIRFWSKVNKYGPVHPVLGTRCWLWTGAKSKRGPTGLFVMPGRKTVRAPRLAWTLIRGTEIPEGLHVCHHCDVPLCVNANEHLFVGTRSDNMKDCVAKGRHVSPTRDLGLAARGEDHAAAKLTLVAVQHIRREYRPGSGNQYRPGSGSLALLASKYGVSKATIMDVVRFRTWKSSGGVRCRQGIIS